MKPLNIGLATTPIFLIAIYVYYDLVRKIFLTAGLLFIASLVICIIYGLFNLTEKIRIRRAERIKAEKDANMTIVQADGQVYVHDLRRDHWSNLTRNPNLYVNGKLEQPSEMEMLTWQLLNSKSSNGRSQPLSLLSEDPRPLDLVTVFTQPTQSYACIGGQQTGKTYQMQHIASYWLRQGITPLVVGPKWDRGEWFGCQMFGGKEDYGAVGHGIEVVRNLAAQRHKDETKSHKQHCLLPVFFDDWTPTVVNCPSAEQMILEASTLFASVNVILYFLLHSDTREAWGVNAKGAALKNNFIKLFILPFYDEDGFILRSRTKGVIRFSGEKEDRPVQLFNTPIIQPVSVSDLVVVNQPDEQEQVVLDLWTRGQSYRTITSQVWGQVGDFYNRKVDGIIEMWGEK